MRRDCRLLLDLPVWLATSLVDDGRPPVPSDLHLNFNR